MARVIEEFPDNTRNTKYPWHEWTDGNIWELEMGTDFKQKPESMRQACVKIAKSRGMTIRSRKIERDKKLYLIVQFTPATAPKKPPARGAKK